ncbi:MAG TPA: SAM-dependent chlorinase/fluorinase [Bryobacteraceae bacterium]|jgi:S-adenosylmethionine hydrolase|nr:SAM-dependent chlorinase/fluorinase [Bryobacteraceae bacterium]
MAVITLTTDFGSSDHFVGAMKGVILSIAPRATIVDISHEIAPQNVNEGAFVIGQAWKYFPQKTVHVVVVDPGVGSARRAILCQAGGQFFIAPDNGVLSMIYDAAKPAVREISNARVMRKEISKTFHGRDVFAPAAAHLARGLAPARFGRPIADFIRLEALKPRPVSRNVWRGVILKVDHFGNLITNFSIDDFAEVKTAPMELRIAGKRIRRLALTFAEAEIGESVAIPGSAGFLEIAANHASAANLLNCGAGTELELEIFPGSPDAARVQNISR